ncbi:carbohydrate kinase family protein [Egicoccus halophilus]|uniref:Fructokinase n=1 Tax=Egicoccus halophilus TaxID=1670830 RepID=A0A8J3A9S9_9ACTN|nr:carbohydrate kinase [Egicoccus halophilus]GGI07860.1 fructokinase [Egicoccus halophilus]
MIVVVGEALVDLAPQEPRAGGLLRPLLGGSPYNVAVGLGRLGTPAAFLGGLSRDAFGRQLADRLTAEGVSLELAGRTDAPTTLAVVHLDDEGRASYGFYLEGTSAAGLRQQELTAVPDGAAVHVSLGAVTLETRPAGQALRQLLARRHGDALVSLDPNVRPSVIDDLPAYARLLERSIGHTGLVKVSDEDLQLLYPDLPAEQAARRWVASGPGAVVVTRGPDGAVALLASGERVEVPGERVEVADTVGAGDAFTSGLLHALGRRGAASASGVRSLDPTAWAEALRTAVRVAAITCTRQGADPPRRAELGDDLAGH